ncbi:hypothetical protein PVAND_014967 [Polypedilum vanderplanki]|uniref:Uncharacterized protein n=1 Tax=Polypedilum vanderplanki TaxID=319348 RepID=A0A9J6BBP4_POLVA|nr:hypothetical protein PVAND_014967 [Polypedilum vanderplanki]
MSGRRKSAANVGTSLGAGRRPSSMNFNIKNETLRTESRGTKPTSNPTSIKEVLTIAVLHFCKKTVFFDTRLKVALYLLALFFVSLIGDFVPFPKSYFSRSDNLFNVFFVKIGWFWTLIFSVPFLFFTSSTLTFGDRDRVLKHHLPRLAIATFFWYSWTSLFNIIENSYGRCNNKIYFTKRTCLNYGAYWKGFDISGHVFILIYSSLVLIEECKPIISWENIKEHLKIEEHSRRVQDPNPSSNVLKNLENKELTVLKTMYDKYTPLIRLLFVAMTLLQILWDIMLVCTMLYYHRMVEKVSAGIIAIVTWYFTYRFWYPSKQLWPEAVGTCNFKYQQKPASTLTNVNLARRASLLAAAKPTTSSPKVTTDIPKFMGNPIYKTAAQRNDLNVEMPTAGQGKYDFQPPPPKFL